MPKPFVILCLSFCSFTLVAVGCLRLNYKGENQLREADGLPRCVDLGNGTAFDDFGAGTPSNPYSICNKAQFLDLIANPSAWNSTIRLPADIDLTGETLTPIGTRATPFTGRFYGLGYTISNPTIHDDTGDYIGVFGVVSGANALIHDLTIENADIRGRAYVGALAGSVDRAASISNAHSSGTVAGARSVGGLIGKLGTEGEESHTTSGMIHAPVGILGHSSSSADVGTNVSSGLILGQHDNAGGLVGSIGGGVVYNSFATGDVLGFSRVGGLIGGLVQGSALNTYASGEVSSGGADVGGLIGQILLSATVRNSFATGDVTGGSTPENAVSPFIGSLDASTDLREFSDNFYYSGSTCTNTSGSCTTTTTPTPIATVSDFHNSSNGPMPNWNFTLTWQTQDSSFPVLRTSASRFNPDTWEGCASHLSDVPFAGGDGSPERPFLICTPTQFMAINTDNETLFGRSFRVMQNIDFSTIATEDTIALDNGDPQSDASTLHFSGVFDGGGHTLSNVSIRDQSDLDPDSDQTPNWKALFRNLKGASIKNFRVSNIVVGEPVQVGTYDGGYSYGAVVAYSRFSAIQNIVVQGEVHTGSYTFGGGFAFGLESNVYVSRITSDVDVYTSYAGFGFSRGLFGTAEDILVLGSVNIAGGADAIAGVYYLEGRLSRVLMANTVASGTDNVAGLANVVHHDGLPPDAIIENSFTVATLNWGGATTGGQLFVTADPGATITNVYRLPNSSCTPACTETDGTEAAAVSDFHGSSHPVYSTWDFTNVWQSNSGGLPTLRHGF